MATFIETIAPEIKLTPEQVAALLPKETEFMAGQKQAWEKEVEPVWSKKANDNAENILRDVSGRVEAISGIKREPAQKYADYLQQASELYFKGKETSLKEKELKLEKLIADGNGGEAAKAQLAEVQRKLEVLQQKEALFAEYEKENYKEKYLNLSTEVQHTKENNAFLSVKPAFSDKVNKYEAAAKWDAFIKSVKAKHTIEFDSEGNAIAIDKENKFKTSKLEELVKADKELTELVKGSKQITGTGATSGKVVNYDGIPFELPENATTEQKTIAIRNYLTAKGIGKLDTNYGKEFAEMMNKINEAQKKA